MVDCDPQANSTGGLGFPHNPERIGVYEVLVDRIPMESAIIKTEFDGLDLLPSGRHLAGANVELAGEEDRVDRLTMAFEAIRDKYDFIFIDCPPALDLLTLNALVAADSVLIPIQCEYFALEGISALMETIDQLRDGLNPRIQIEGVLLTMFDERTTLASQVASDCGTSSAMRRVPNGHSAEHPSWPKRPATGSPLCSTTCVRRAPKAIWSLAREVLERTGGRMRRGQTA